MDLRATTHISIFSYLFYTFHSTRFILHHGQVGMMAYIVAMCIALPLTLLPQHLLYRMKWISRVQQEKWALRTGQFCARWLLRLIPFCTVQCIPHHDDNPEPSIWVCNHISSLDVFLLLATDYQLRGPRKRPIKVVYVRIENYLPPCCR